MNLGYAFLLMLQLFLINLLKFGILCHFARKNAFYRIMRQYEVATYHRISHVLWKSLRKNNLF